MPASTKYPTVTVREKATSKGISLYLDIYHNGERRKQSLQITLTGDRLADGAYRSQAEDIRRRVEKQLMDGMPSKRESVLLVEALDRYAALDHMATAARQSASVRQIVLGVVGDTLTLDKLTDGHLRTILAVMREGRSLYTVAGYWRIVLRSLRYAYEQGWMTKDVTRGMPRVSTPRGTTREYLTEGELQALLSTPAPCADVRDAFVCGLLTGLRISDIERLEARHVTLSWATDALNGEKVVQGGVIRITVQKTKQELRLPLSRVAAGLLAEKVAERSATGHPTGKLFRLPSHGVVNSRIREWATQAGLGKHITFHVSRHTFATLSLSRGGSLLAVSRYLGHASVGTTQVYLHLIDGQLEAAAEAIPDVRGMLERGTGTEG